MSRSVSSGQAGGRGKNSLPVGNVTAKAVKGGLDVADPETNESGYCWRSHCGGVTAVPG